MLHARRRWTLEHLEPRTVPAAFAVTTTADLLNASDVVLSLREAVRAANATPEADTTSVPAGTYSLTLTGANEDAALTGDLDITGSVTITGAGVSSTVIDGANADRVFDVLGGPVAFIGLTVTHGKVTADAAYGGGIRSSKNLNITNCAVTDNQAIGTSISAATGNSAGGVARGGGIDFQSATLRLTNCTVSANTARGGDANGSAGNTGGRAYGGGIATSRSANFYLTNSTVADNLAAGGASGPAGTSNAGGTPKAVACISTHTSMAARPTRPN